MKQNTYTALATNASLSASRAGGMTDAQRAGHAFAEIERILNAEDIGVIYLYQTAYKSHALVVLKNKAAYDEYAEDLTNIWYNLSGCPSHIEIQYGGMSVAA